MADKKDNNHTVFGVGDNGESEKFEVKLKRPVTIQGFTYKPGERNVVSQELVDAMGDAVEDVEPAR